MPSKSKQFNVRLSAESQTRVNRLVESMSAAIGIPVSKSDVIQAALVELEKRYPAEPLIAKGKGKRK